MNLRNALMAVIALAASAPSWACDLCAVYAASAAQGHAQGIYAAVTEQFTRYDQLREQGHRIADDSGQFLESSVTQLIAGYGFSDRLSMQFALPYIERRFRRPEGGAIDEGTVNGFGDASLIASYTPYRWMKESSTFAVNMFGGVKFATGNSDRLAEELSESEPAPGEPANGIHGHDLSIGSGSTDFLFGASALGRAQRWLATADLQYALRRRGDFDYRFGDDLQWRAGFGRYLLLAEERTLALVAAAEGEYKRYDDLNGERLGDTHCGGWMLGPQLQYTAESRYSAEFGAVFPVQQFNSEIQTTAGYRIRAAIGYRF